MERLVIIEEGKESTYNIASRVVTLGRSSKNDVTIKERNASRKHCNVLRVGDSWFAVDCHSQNGTFVNGQKIKKTELKHGDTISIGSIDIKFYIGEVTKADREKEYSAPKEDIEFENIKTAEDKIIPGKEEVKLVENVEEIEEVEEPPIASELEKILEQEEAKDEKAEEVIETLQGNVKVTQSMPKVLKRDQQLVNDEIELKIDSIDDKKGPREKFARLAEPTRFGAPPIIELEQEGMQKLELMKQSYKKFQETMKLKEHGLEKIAKLVFISVLSGGHFLLAGKSIHRKQLLLKDIADTLGLSYKAIIDPENISQAFQKHHIVFIENTHWENVESHFLSMLLFEERDYSWQVPKILVIGVKDIAASIPLYLQTNLMFCLELPVLSLSEEMNLLKTFIHDTKKSSILTIEEFRYLQQCIEKINISDELYEYVTKIIRATRPHAPGSLEIVKDHLVSGAEVYTSAMLLKASRTLAAMSSRESVKKEDIQTMAKFLIPHQLTLNAEALRSKKNAQDIYNAIMKDFK